MMLVTTDTCVCGQTGSRLIADHELIGTSDITEWGVWF